MSVSNLEKRVEALEREIQLIKSVVKQTEEKQQPWWERLAGSFKDDPVFDEIVEAGVLCTNRPKVR